MSRIVTVDELLHADMILRWTSNALKGFMSLRASLTMVRIVTDYPHGVSRKVLREACCINLKGGEWSTLVRGLLAGRWIEIVDDPTDGRQKIVRATEAGRARAHQFRIAIADLNGELDDEPHAVAAE